ncbi:MAG: flagellar motor protein MotB [Bacteroidetes bacterium HGW-Bacteroidetes-12]|nr:MAG: flagellar motor protein MotB [Bacteroidetes bacterium HGW-Bacteroidetes-12]
MKKLNFIPFIFLAIIIFTSCKSNSKFGDKVDKFFWSKRYKAVLTERDELCFNNKQLRNDTTEMGIKLRKTENNLATLTVNYDELASKTGIQLAQLTTDLKLKSAELETKEALLLEREKRLREMEAIVSKQDSLTNALNNIVKNALLGFNADELSVEMRNGKVYVSMNDKLLFKSGSAGVEEKGKQAIKKLAEVLNKNTEIDIAIEGHTDNIPIKTAQYKDNWDLSVARATSIVRMLSEENGLQPKRLTASGKGEYFPIATNETAEGRAKNRRTEIILSPKLDELFKLLQKTK